MAQTFYEFFCGAGMAREGLGPQWECTFANDIDPSKARSYAANFGHVGLKVGDVAHLKLSDLPGAATLAWSSFPCQDLSEAGAGAGLDGFRSNAIWPCLRLVKALRVEGRGPRMVALENVAGLLSPRSEKFLDAICDALADAGYRFGVVMIDARRNSFPNHASVCSSWRSTAHSASPRRPSLICPTCPFIRGR